MKSNTSYDLVIIGGGPAGLTAAIYARRAELKVLLVEQGAVGGKMIKTYDIVNYPGFEKILGVDLALKMQAQVKNLAVDFLSAKVIQITVQDNKKLLHLENGDVLKVPAVIIATGTLEKELVLSNNENRLVPGVKEFYGKGVSYCAVCDGAFFRDADIVVVGGGNSAIEEAIYLTRFAKQVFIVHRRTGFRASEHALKLAQSNPKIRWRLNFVVKAIEGDDKVTAVLIENTLTQETQRVAVSAVFPYIGSIPISDFVKDLGICDSAGYIVTNHQMATKVPGIYAAGDIRKTNLRQITTAVGDGAMAAQEVVAYLDSLKNA